MQAAGTATGTGLSSVPLPPPSAPVGKRKLAKVGLWGSSLVAADEVVVDGLPGMAQESAPRRRSLKEVREQENDACIGGLRSPWKSVEGNPQMKAVGRALRATLEKALERYPVLEEAADGGEFNDASDEQLEAMEFVRQELALTLGTAHPQDRGASQHWHPHLVQAWVSASGDVEVDLPAWLRSGTPMGVGVPIIPRGVFPEVDPAEAAETIDRIYSYLEPSTNYSSYDEARGLVDPELKRLREAGFLKTLGSWEQVREFFGDDVVVSKLAAIVKTREDGSKKTRLVVDYRRSGVNAHVKAGERVVLPRLRDALDDVVWMMGADGGAEEIGFHVADFKDAFHTMPLDEKEWHYQVVMTSPGVFEVFTTVVFGGVSSPLVWGRAGAMLMRSGQSLFEAMELLIQCYVDDPLLVIRGPAARRRHLAAILITWWRALGPSLSWSKMGKGTRVIWIGAALEVLDRYVVKAELPKPFVDALRAELQEMALKDVVKLSLLRRSAGRGSWATGMAPAVRNFLQPFWATIADVARADLQRGGQRMRWRGEPMVHTTRVRSAVVWLLALLSGAAGAAALQRTLDWRVAQAPITLLVTADASPWGLGAILSLVDGTIVAWLASDVTALDCQVLKITYGDCSGQAVVEALALLVALRVWAPQWSGQRVRAHIRSDSVAALGALRKLASPAPSLNAVAREAALDIAASTYGVELTSYAHISGALNDWADALSRLSAPVPRSVPLALDEALRTEVPVRGLAWWRARVESSRQRPHARVRTARYHMNGS